MLFDVRKGFGFVEHHRASQAAIETELPPWMLKLLISMYRMPRTLDMRGCASDLIDVEQTI
eukprot:6343863-Pyramimonas_sp.AAC.1